MKNAFRCKEVMVRILVVILFAVFGIAFAHAEELWGLNEHIFVKRIDNSSPVYIKNRYQPVIRQKLQEHLPQLPKPEVVGDKSLVYVADYEIPELSSPECAPRSIELRTEKDVGLFTLSGWFSSPSVIDLPSAQLHPIPGRMNVSNSFIHFGHQKKLALSNSAAHYDPCPYYLLRWYEIFPLGSQSQPATHQNELQPYLSSGGGHFFDFKNGKKYPGGFFLLDDFQIILMSAEQFFLTQTLSDDDSNLPLDFDQIVVQVIHPNGGSERINLSQSDWYNAVSHLTGNTSQLLDDFLPKEVIIYSRSDIMRTHLLLETWAETAQDYSNVPGIQHWGGGWSTLKSATSQQAASEPSSASGQPNVLVSKKATINPGRDDGDNPEEGQQLSCKICSRAFLSQETLDRHMKEHASPSSDFTGEGSTSEPAKKIASLRAQSIWNQYFSHYPQTLEQLTEVFGGTNPAYWNPRVFVNQLAERTHDDLFMRYAKAARSALKANNPMPVPGMHFTIEKMHGQIEFFLSHSWLSEEDRKALEVFRGDLEALQRQGYPYFKSIEKSLVFSSIQFMFYFLSRPHQQEWREAIDQCGINEFHNHCDEIKVPRLESIGQVIGLPWQELFKRIDGGDAWQLIQGIQATGAYGDESIARYTANSVLSMPRYKDDILFFPSFAALSVKSLNMMTHLHFAPIGLLDEIFAFHDNVYMSCGAFPWHDLSHLSQTTYLILSFAKQQNLQNLEAYELIRLFYESKNKLDSKTFHVTELLLFYFLHEKVEKWSSIYIASREMDFKQMLEVTDVLSSSGAWSDLPKKHLEWLESDELIKGILVLGALHKREVIEQKNINNSYDDLMKKISGLSSAMRMKRPVKYDLGDCRQAVKDWVVSSIERLEDTSWKKLYIDDKVRVAAAIIAGVVSFEPKKRASKQ